MKTAKIKVALSNDAIASVNQLLDEQSWIWNQALKVARHNHCLTWYSWAEKLSKKGNDGFPPFELDGIIEVPLMLNPRSAWVGASCRIAVGGPRWTKDTSIVIKRRKRSGNEWVTEYCHGYKLVDDDRPWEPITPAKHEYIRVNGKEVKQTSDLDRMAGLNAERQRQELPPLTAGTSDYVSGTLMGFDVAWSAYLSTAMPDRHIPKWKDGDRHRVESLKNPQRPPGWKGDSFLLTGGIEVTPADKSWQQRISGLQIRTYTLIRRPSGYYICLALASSLESTRPAIATQLKKLGSQLKKEAIALGLSKEEAIAYRDEHPDYQELANKLSQLESDIEQELFDQSTCTSPSSVETTIKLGLKNVVTTSSGKEFEGNKSRLRIETHISDLQHKLDIMREANDRKLGAKWKLGQRKATSNEQKLQAKISRLHERGANSSNAYNHKLSTRLVRTYGTIRHNDLDLPGLVEAPDPILASTGDHWEPNGATQKTRLANRVKNQCLGDLTSKMTAKAAIARKEFVSAES